MSKCRYGGWVSFTAHLSLKQNWSVYRITKTNEKRMRQFGYGVNYRNVNTDNLPDNILITAIDKTYYKYLEYIPDGSHIVIHDPTELKKQVIPHLSRFKIIVIRETVKKVLKEKYDLESKFLHHPFYQYPVNRNIEKKNTVSVSRIDYDKHTDILINANEKMDVAQHIDIYGKINNLYVHRKLGDSLEPYYCGCFERSFIDLDKILTPAKYVVDMSAIVGDGAGSQYTFLEAIHQDCVLILNHKWTCGLKTDFLNGINCFIVKDEDMLINILTTKVDLEPLKIEARKLLDNHINVDWGKELMG